MYIALYILTSLLFLYLLATIPYLFILACAGRFGKLKTWFETTPKARIAIIIPSYKEDNIIVDTATQAFTHNYPDDKFLVTVIADQLQPATIQRLKAIPVNVVEVSWEKSMKAKSLDAAFTRLAPQGFDLALILDADNIMSPGCLEKINHAYQNGWKAIQCHRTAKNKNNAVAILDALSEEINNTIFRRGQRVLGLSCALIGSGMAFEFNLIRDIFAAPGIQDNPGEDKEVELQLIRQNIKVEFLDDAWVYDEKVQRKEVFERQRTRWLGTQLQGVRPLLSKDMRGSFTKGIYRHKLFEWFLLPRILLMALLAFLTAVAIVDACTGLRLLYPSWFWWIGMTALYGLTLLIAIPATYYNAATLKALLKIPALVISMFKALLGVRKNRSGFIHTPKEFSN